MGKGEAHYGDDGWWVPPGGYSGHEGEPMMGRGNPWPWWLYALFALSIILAALGLTLAIASLPG